MYSIYNNWYIFCACDVGWLLAGFRCSKHVHAINRNKQKTNSTSCWSYYTDILRHTVNKTLSLKFLVYRITAILKTFRVVHRPNTEIIDYNSTRDLDDCLHFSVLRYPLWVWVVRRTDPLLKGFTKKKKHSQILRMGGP
jgi:hypothetical protein